MAHKADPVLIKGLNSSGIEEFISTIEDAVKIALYGINDSGQLTAIPVDGDGHMEVALHSPRLPFGSIHAEKLTALFQCDAVYQLNPHEQIASTSGSGTATNGTNNLFNVTTGETIYSYGSIQSRRRLRYRPGQGVIVRYTALFPANAANSILVAGCGTAESGFYFGYNGTSFGILHVTDGKREIRTLTISTASTTAENVTVTLDGIGYSVAVTNSNDAIKTAYEISQGTYAGWEAQQRGNTVIFIANTAAVKSGSYTLSGTTAAGTFAQDLAGAASTDTWIAQSSWNGDKLDGTGPSGITLDPTKGNVYQIDIQYLGFGSISFKVEVISDANNANFVTVHTIKYPNSFTAPSISQPSFPFTMAAYSAGSTTDLSVKCGSFAGFIEGDKNYYGPVVAYGNTSTSVTTTNYYHLITIRNDYEFNGRPNQSVINIVSFGGCHDDATPVEIFLIRNATLVGTPNFSQNTSHSPVYVDTSATTLTFSDNDQVVYRLPVGQTGSILMDLTNEDINLQPGDTLSVAARTVTGTATYVLVSLNTREDQ